MKKLIIYLILINAKIFSKRPKVKYGNFLFGLIIGTLQILTVAVGYFSNRVINLSADYVIILALLIVIIAIFFYLKMKPFILDFIERNL